MRKSVLLILLTLFCISCNKLIKAQKVKEKKLETFTDSVYPKTLIGKKFDNEISKLNQIKLPIGKKLLLDFKFPVQWDFANTQQKNRKKSNDEKTINNLLGDYYDNKKTNKPLDSNRSKQTLPLSSLGYNKNDYRSKFFNFKSTYNYSILRLPNIDSVRVLLVSYLKYNINPNSEFPYEVSYEDIITIKDNLIIDRLNIEAFEGNISLGGLNRLFFIDDKYIIHTKDFYYGELQGDFVGYNKWKIKKNGKIVSFITEKDSIFNSNQISNNFLNGFFKGVDTDLVLLSKSKKRDFASEYSYSEGHYKEGEKNGIWKYYSIGRNNKKEELLYTEDYKDGQLIKREFVKDKLK